jgi:hypothetical protein
MLVNVPPVTVKWWESEKMAPLWRGRMADVWKSIRTLVSILLYHAPILCYSICLYSKYCQIVEFTLIPRSTWPVQGSRPEVPPRDLTPYSRSATSGLFSHPNPQIRTKQPHHLGMPFSHFATLFFINFYTLQLGTEVHIILSSFAQPLPGSPTQNLNLRTGTFPLLHRHHCMMYNETNSGTRAQEPTRGIHRLRGLSGMCISESHCAWLMVERGRDVRHRDDRLHVSFH